MIFCGQEEPLCANRHVPVYDDDRHRYLPSDMTMHRLVRYSFVWQDMVKSGDHALSMLGRQVIASLVGDAFWLNIWRVPAPGEAKHYALRALRSRRIREGWSVTSQGELEYAWIALPSTAPYLFWPASYHFWEGCIGVLITSEDVVRALPHMLQSRSLTSAATTGKIVPSQAWLTWCADTQASLLYPVIHHNDREGMISVGTQCLPIHQWYIEQRLERLYVGEAAYKAWQYERSDT